MEYASPTAKVKPRLIIHGGAGNLRPDQVTPEKYAAFRRSLLTIVTRTNAFMTTPQAVPSEGGARGSRKRLPTALETATYAVTMLEDDPMFNAGHGAVFTRDGLNELEASVMVSRGFAKRGVGVTGLRRVRNPIQLARKLLEHGENDLLGRREGPPSTTASAFPASEGDELDIPSAQGHTLLHGPSAELLAERYGLALVEPSYFFTQNRWDEHIRALDREKKAAETAATANGTKSSPALVTTATWSPDEYLPQGTTGAVALDADGVICCATSTGGLTNKLTGRIGDTPSVGAGFWAEEWEEEKTGEARAGAAKTGAAPASLPPWDAWRNRLSLPGPVVELSSNLRRLLADCLPTPFVYQPVFLENTHEASTAAAAAAATTHLDKRHVSTRAIALSGTGNGDSFLRTAAARTAVGVSRWTGTSGAEGLRRVAGRGGELQRSAEWRWGLTGEGEGGMIGIEVSLVRDVATGEVVMPAGVGAKAAILQDYNCGGMLRAWIDDDGGAHMMIWDGEQDQRFL
ncbi:nucleophile aminohydrolase [Xylariales sp. PMI_506]|nr:nucleophile aminohydrolase [Xylariales sp. PMI_506]